MRTQPARSFADLKRERFATRYDMVCAAIEGRQGQFYSAEIAREIGLRAAVVGTALRRLEREGKLSSHFEPSPISGHGRRYYRLTVAGS
jgi:predicted transcriptional regulator